MRSRTHVRLPEGVPGLAIPELVEYRLRSVARLTPGAPALNREEALELLEDLRAALEEVRGSAQLAPPESGGCARNDRLTPRLAPRAEFFRPLTRHLFEDAGIGTGMRVHVGTGAADVSLPVLSSWGRPAWWWGRSESRRGRARDRASRGAGLVRSRFWPTTFGLLEGRRQIDGVPKRDAVLFDPKFAYSGCV
jgi:hypothetical protein